MVRNSKNRSLKVRVMSVFKGQSALQARNGKPNAFTSLKTLYKVLKAETEAEKAQIRGILNHDHINGKKVFERAKIDGKKRSGTYRLYAQSINKTEGLAA
jgi:hypothetical protein